MAVPNPIIRKSFGLKEQIRPELEASYHSPLIERIKAEGHQLCEGRLTVRLAHEFGFCYGVDRAIDYAYQTRMKFPKQRMFLTNEIIHNPQVNAKLKEMGIEFLSGSYAKTAALEDIQKGDVVIIPAFGTSVTQLAELQKKECILVDTTCGSVMSVWKRVESYSRDGFTSVIHGKYDHEETIATSSRALSYPQGRYLIVRDKQQAQYVCDYITEGGDPQAFLNEFQPAVSQGFDPDNDLTHIGCANQTTMLSSESMEIANMLQRAMITRYGDKVAAENFRHFDTICSATQDRQDALRKLLQKPLDLVLIVGGFNSSNTSHLAEIALGRLSFYHIESAEDILSADQIQARDPQTGKIGTWDHWLPAGTKHIGITSGASTPDVTLLTVIQKIRSL